MYYNLYGKNAVQTSASRTEVGIAKRTHPIRAARYALAGPAG